MKHQSKHPKLLGDWPRNPQEQCILTSPQRRHAVFNVAFVMFAHLLCFVFSPQSKADVERYKSEAGYLGRLNELGLTTVEEGFESAAWDQVRSDYPSIISTPEVTSQGMTWEAAAKQVFPSYSSRVHGVTTNNNWSRSGQWGIYEDHSGEPYPTTIRVSSLTPMYGIGGWFNTNPDGQSAGFLFEDRTTANEPGYILLGLGAMYPGDNPAFGHEFIGIVDPSGFNSVVLTGTLEINEEGVLEGGTIYGADDFTIAITVNQTGDLDIDGDVDGLDFTTGNVIQPSDCCLIGKPTTEHLHLLLAHAPLFPSPTAWLSSCVASFRFGGDAIRTVQW